MEVEKYSICVLGYSGNTWTDISDTYVPGIYLGLGKGGMERLIVYPNLLWALGFGGWIIGKYGKE